MPYTKDGTPYARGSETSRDAAEGQRSKKTTDAAAIVRYLLDRGRQGATCDHISGAISMQYTTATARINELVKRGILVRTPRRQPTRTGATASVLVHRDFATTEELVS